MKIEESLSLKKAYHLTARMLNLKSSIKIGCAFLHLCEALKLFLSRILTNDSVSVCEYDLIDQ